MCIRERIDITFDFRTDTPPGKDPDSHSPTLRRYHKLLWSKTLPNGIQFELVDSTPHVYLHHQSKLGEFWLSSDAVIPTFTRENKIRSIIDQIPSDQLDLFNTIGYTMGGMMLFPGHRIGQKMTINGARGFHPSIKDRFDLTIECIMRHYRGEWSPLQNTFHRYADFFDVFENFRGFVEFFLLQDIVDNAFNAIRFFMPFDNFQRSPLPMSKDEYIQYMQNAIEFIKARNMRIQQYWDAKQLS